MGNQKKEILNYSILQFYERLCIALIQDVFSFLQSVQFTAPSIVPYSFIQSVVLPLFSTSSISNTGYNFRHQSAYRHKQCSKQSQIFLLDLCFLIFHVILNSITHSALYMSYKHWFHSISTGYFYLVLFLDDVGKKHNVFI